MIDNIEKPIFPLLFGMMVIVSGQDGIGLRVKVSILDKGNIGFHDFQIENIIIDGYTISIDALVQPVCALRMIEINIPIPPRTFGKIMPMIDVRYSWCSPVKKSKITCHYYFKNKYDRIGNKYVFK